MRQAYPFVSARIYGLTVFTSLALAAAPAGDPAWWRQGNPPVIDSQAVANNQGAANIGQAKWMARSALDTITALDPALGAAIAADLVGTGKPLTNWDGPHNQVEADRQHFPLQAGQLKAIAAPFYQHLNAVAPQWLAAERSANHTEKGGIFPWTDSLADDRNNAVATVGQLKAVFALHLTEDSDGDGISDFYEWAHFGGLDGTQDSDGDGLTDAEEYIHHTDPHSAVDNNANGIPDDWETVHAGQFTVWPPVLAKTVAPGQTGSGSFKFFNDTGAPVTWTAAVSNDITPGYSWKNSISDPQPDGGYIIWTNTPGSVVFPVDGVSQVTSGWGNAPTPSNFTFYGQTCSGVHVSSKGVLVFDNSATFTPPAISPVAIIPGTGAPLNAIAPLWNIGLNPHANPGFGPNVLYSSSYSAAGNQTHVHFYSIRTGGPVYDFTTTLVEDGRIIIRYYSETTTGNFANTSVGIQGPTVGRGLTIAEPANPATSTALGAGKVIEISPNTRFFTLPVLTGTVPAHGTASAAGNFATFELADSQHDADVSFTYTGGAGPLAVKARLIVPNSAGTVVLTGPSTNPPPLQSASIPLLAKALDHDGVAKVEFYDGNTKIGEVPSSLDTAKGNFAFTWTNAQSGNRSITAKIVDQKGQISTSSPLALVIAADIDADGWEDGWETTTYGDLAQTPTSDYDADGLNNTIDTDPLHSATVADPDGAGFYRIIDGDLSPTSFAGNLIGRWDFEQFQIQAPAPTGFSGILYPDSTTSHRDASYFLGIPVAQDGMVSLATRLNQNFITIPPALLNNRASYTVSFWAALDAGSVENSVSPVGLFSHHRYTPNIPPSNQVNWGLYQIVANGLWLQKDGSGGEVLKAGTYSYANHNNGVPLNPATTTVTGVSISAPYGTFDDGKWHHYVFEKESAYTNLYIDGALRGRVSHNNQTITVNDFNGISLGRLAGPPPEKIAVQPGNQQTAKGKFDRLRVWSTVLNLGQVTDLYHEDIDHDDLWDFTEQATGVWHDLNGNNAREVNEVSYVSSPFVWQPPDTDSDGDGATDLEEQAAGTNAGDPDFDHDLIPDGWELKNGLNPLVPNNGDTDLDGLSDVDEYRYNSDPHDTDSDNDNVPDGVEFNQGSNPGDGSDQGQPLSPEDKLTIKLGVGDRSGSHSEDYVMNVFKLDPETGKEERFYTLRSGGPGLYAEKTLSIFRKGESYTFQIDWQGTNGHVKDPNQSTMEVPDFDYHMVVEPQGENYGALIDSYDPVSGKADGTPILDPQDVNPGDDDDDDVADFLTTVEKRRVLILAAETVVGEPGTPDETSDFITAEAYLKPVVEMTVASTSIEGGNLKITVQGTVTDAMSRFATSASERPQTLNFLRDGQTIRSIPIGSSVGTGFSFTETLTIPNASPVSYLIRAETSANVSGLTGFDQCVASLVWRDDPLAFPGMSAPLSIYFPAAPASSAMDQAQAYIGAGTPPAGTSSMVESAAASDVYTGQVSIPASPSALLAPCKLAIPVPRIFSTSAVDSLVLDFRYTAPGFPENRIYGTWVETGANTRIFRPTGWFFGNRSLQVAYVDNIPASHKMAFEPCTIRLHDLPGQRAALEDIKIKAGNVSYNLVKTGKYWYPEDPLKSGAIKLFLPASLPVPERLNSPGYDAAKGELAFSLVVDGTNSVQAPKILTEPGVPEDPNDAASGGPSVLGGPSTHGGPSTLAENPTPWYPGQAVTVDQMIWAYKLINADNSFALELLDGYLRGGHKIETGDVSGDLDLDVKLNNLFTDTDNIWTIQVEEDENPVYCARLLYEGLKQASCYTEVFKNYQFEDDFDNITAFQTALNSAVDQTRETAIFATQMYLSGLGLINEGNDWILVLNDVSEGHYESLAGALPFVPAGLIKTGGHLIIRKGATVLESLDTAGVSALRQVCREKDLRVMGVIMDQQGFSESIRKALSSNGGPITAPFKHGELREAMTALAPDLVKTGKRAHHDLPWTFRDWFARHGLNVNDPAFGRWVTDIEHVSWHSGIGEGAGGAFNKAWSDFIAAEDLASPYTAAQILDKLGQIRSQFPVTGP